MSFAEASVPGLAQKAASETANADHPFPKIRLDLIYFALAGFDLITIMLTLLLSNHIMDLYQQSVSRSAAWSARVGELVELAQYAQEANAPGNDVFDSHDVAAERVRRDAGLRLYREQRDLVLQELARSEDAQAVRRQIELADGHMAAMMSEADSIFAEIESGDEAAAGRRMATMDRVYAQLSRTLLQAILTVQAIEDTHLSRRVDLAGDLRRLEFLVLALIFMIVIGVAFYGRRIQQVMRKTQASHSAMLVELEAANQGLEQYADNVAHELRNPVNKVLLASEVALSRSRGAEEYQDTLVSIVEECQRLSSIVGSLLFLARARRTKIELERQAINLCAELELIRDYFDSSAQEAGLTLSVDCAPELSLRADRTLFQRAVSNLIINAIAHTPRGGAVRIVAAMQERGWITVEVQDNGEGVSLDAQARVFDRFFRVDAARSATSGRIGLGLPIAKSIMDLHGGSIDFLSQPGGGTHVTLAFPV